MFSSQVPFCGFAPSPTGSQDGGGLEREMLTPEYKYSCSKSSIKASSPVKRDIFQFDDEEEEDSQDSGLGMDNNKDKIFVSCPGDLFLVDI